MDGSILGQDDAAAEALRQQHVHDRALASIRQGQRRNEAGGYAVMGAAAAFGEAVRPGRWLALAATAARVFCIGLMTAVIPLYLFLTVSPGG